MSTEPNKEAIDTTSSETTGEPVGLQKPAKEPKPRRSHKLRTTLIIFLVLILGVVLAAGWIGLLPGVSNVLGANKARDLGVRYTAADLASYQTKTGIQFADFANAPQNPEKPGKKLIFGDPRTVENLSISQEELTAAVNSLGWRSMPLDNVQVRAGDGTVEVSGNLRTENVTSFVKFIGGVGYAKPDVDTVASWAEHFLSHTPVYVKASVSAENDQLSFALQDAKVGRVAIPQDIAEKVLRTGLSNAIVNAGNYQIKSASLTNGQLNFSGTYPTTIYVAH